MSISINISSSMIDAISTIEGSIKRLAVVLSDDGKGLGTLTDGDIRRHILEGGSLQDSVEYLMNKNPVLVYEGTSENNIRKILRDNNIRTVPIIDLDEKYVESFKTSIIFLKDFVPD